MTVSIQEDGGCLCGSVRFRVTAPPYFVAVCSRTFCQRITGSAYYNVESMFRVKDFALTGAGTTVFSHESRAAACRSTSTSAQGAAPRCSCAPTGFPIASASSRAPSTIPNWFDRTPLTTEYFFVAEAPRGMVIPAGYNTYPGHARALDGSDNIPVRQARTEIVGAVDMLHDPEVSDLLTSAPIIRFGSVAHPKLRSSHLPRP